MRFLFGYFLFRASKEKVTRRKVETGSGKCATYNGYRVLILAAARRRGLGSVNRQHGKVLLAVADLQVHFAVLHLAEQALAHG